MNTQDKEMKLMEAMSGIKSEYIEAADDLRKAGENSKIVDFSAAQNEEKMAKQKKKGSHRPFFYAKIAAAAVALSMILPNTNVQVAYAMQNIPVVGAYFKLVTFRDYSYQDPYHTADVTVSGLSVDSSRTDTGVKANAEKSAEEVNKEIKKTTDSMIAEFKETLKEKGYSDLKVTTDTVTDNDDWYVIRLNSFQAAASGYEENQYYVISKETGKRVKLADLFKKDSDYRKVISENIIKQMKAAEAADPDKHYWLDEKEDPDFNFKEISENQQFYINKDNQLVIAFQQGDVAPMSMGTQEFIIPESVISGITTVQLGK